MHEKSFNHQLESENKPFTVERVLVAGNRGPCGGVKMALEAADQVLDIVDGREPVYSNWNIVNNAPAMKDLQNKGLINVKNNLELVPENSVAMWTAHGVSREFRKKAKEKNLLIIDVTCQLVNRVHSLVKNAQEEGKHIVYIGIDGHPEPLGVLGELEEENYTFIQPDSNINDLKIPDDKEVVIYSQTTLATDEIKDKYNELSEDFPQIIIPNRWDICPAVDIRQEAAEDLLDNYPVEFLLVGGSPESSHNSEELRKKAEKRGIPNALVDNPSQIQRAWFTQGIKTVGATASASEREEDFQELLDVFRIEGIDPIVHLPQIKLENNKTFRLPLSDINALNSRYNISY